MGQSSIMFRFSCPHNQTKFDSSVKSKLEIEESLEINVIHCQAYMGVTKIWNWNFQNGSIKSGIRPKTMEFKSRLSRF